MCQCFSPAEGGVDGLRAGGDVLVHQCAAQRHVRWPSSACQRVVATGGAHVHSTL